LPLILNPALNDGSASAPPVTTRARKWFDTATSLTLRRRGDLVGLVGYGRTGAVGGGDLEFRAATLRIGFWLGSISLAVALIGVLSGTGTEQRGLLVALTVTAAGANVVWMRIPWRDWLARRRGQILVDLWSAGVLAYVGALVIVGGGSFALLFFLATPFVVMVQTGRRRGVWLLAAAGTCVLVTAVGRLPVAASAMRFALVMVIAGVAVILERAVRREAAAGAEASARAELEHARLTEADHRVKNSLQTVADLLLLGRPEGESADVFELSAARIQSIAAVHRLLSETGDARVRIDDLLELIVANDRQGILLEADPVILDAQAAQRLGLVANELITNARKHGETPILVRLERDDPVIRLSVEDAGRSRPDRFDGGLGLDLVRRVVEQGLGGELVLARLPHGGVHAEATF
jgi:two-component sensor histidine kinase